MEPPRMNSFLTPADRCTARCWIALLIAADGRASLARRASNAAELVVLADGRSTYQVVFAGSGSDARRSPVAASERPGWLQAAFKAEVWMSPSWRSRPATPPGWHLPGPTPRCSQPGHRPCLLRAGLRPQGRGRDILNRRSRSPHARRGARTRMIRSNTTAATASAPQGPSWIFLYSIRRPFPLPRTVSAAGTAPEPRSGPPGFAGD